MTDFQSVDYGSTDWKSVVRVRFICRSPKRGPLDVGASLGHREGCSGRAIQIRPRLAPTANGRNRLESCLMTASPALLPLDPAPRVRASSRLRRMTFRALALLLAWGLIELAALAALFGSDETFSWDVLRKTQSTVAAGGALAKDSQETIHPFQGWAFNPQVSQGVSFVGRTIPVNSLGQVDDGPSIVKRSSDKVVVGIAGGSVAWQMSVAGEVALKSELAKLLGRDVAEIDVVRLAMSGFKQPQQLMTLTWLSSLGAEFDVVVNVDGYNEAMGASDNFKSHVFMAYPTNWHVRTQDIVDPRRYSIAHELMQIRAQRQQRAQDALSSPMSWSPLYNLVWWLRDLRAQSQKADLAHQYLAGHTEIGGKSFANAGPIEPLLTEAETDATIVSIWANSSIQMERLCRGNGCQYIHFLQPNQYLRGSKPLSPIEREDLAHPDSPPAKVIERLYPKFLKRGQELSSTQVRFVDLTRLFEETSETVYVDPWCHYNEQGNQMLARAVAQEIAAALKK